MRPGEIWEARYPNTDRLGPPETVRPVLILAVSPPGENQDSVVVVAHFTAVDERVLSPRKGDLVFEDDYREAGLRCPCVARCRQVVSFSPNRLVRRRGEVHPEKLFAAREIVRELLDL